MNLFETIKGAVTVKQAAEFCGLKVERYDMCHCPFHTDKSPSMKLYPDHYYCFGCHEHGDVIALTAKLMNLTPKEAAIRLADAFHIDISDCLKTAQKKSARSFASHRERLRSLTEKLDIIYQKAELQKREEWFAHAQVVLTDYLELLRQWKQQYAPTSQTEEWNPLFVEAE